MTRTQTSFGFEISALAAPIARRSDPETSKKAAAAVTQSGLRGKQHTEILALVKAHPGLTSRELATLCNYDRYVIARRLPELEKAGLVRKDIERKCEVSGFSAYTWRVCQ